ARMSLGLVLLFGGAMAKFEGFIGLAAAGLWFVLLPWARPSVKASPGLWRLLGFCLAVALPFVCLRVQIPALHYESGWAGDALRHPGVVLSSAPSFFLLIVLRWFVDPGLATWTTESGHLHWAGKWEGFSSLYHHPTLGLTWLTLLLTVILWLLHPASRRQILWLLGVIGTMLVAFSLVFASFVTTSSLDRMLDYYTQEIASSRYLFPLLVAWSATVVMLLFRTTPATAGAKADPSQEAHPCPATIAGDKQP
ncbi:MAG TPA: hypothetical protein VNT26_20800, partial [Candidatus Sulfotelmatobacter sp.]|nr:hypothetical protein [Candidatus Sulfotelmatobacter sp.]